MGTIKASNKRYTLGANSYIVPDFVVLIGDNLADGFNGRVHDGHVS